MYLTNPSYAVSCETLSAILFSSLIASIICGSASLASRLFIYISSDLTLLDFIHPCPVNRIQNRHMDFVDWIKSIKKNIFLLICKSTKSNICFSFRCPQQFRNGKTFKLISLSVRISPDVAEPRFGSLYFNYKKPIVLCCLHLWTRLLLYLH